jgi:hypothetical protein
MLLKFASKYNGLLSFQTDNITSKPLYNMYLQDKPLENTFVLLASNMTPFWNSLPYDNVRSFTEYLGYNSYTGFSAKLKKLKELGMIVIDKGYLYINPFFATKSRDIHNITLEYFMQPVTDKEIIARLIAENENKLANDTRVFEYIIADRLPNTEVNRYYVPNKMLLLD